MLSIHSANVCIHSADVCIHSANVLCEISIQSANVLHPRLHGAIQQVLLLLERILLLLPAMCVYTHISIYIHA